MRMQAPGPGLTGEALTAQCRATVYRPTHRTKRQPAAGAAAPAGLVAQFDARLLRRTIERQWITSCPACCSMDGCS